MTAALAGALAFATLALHAQPSALSLLRLSLLGGTLAAASASDLKRRRIPNRLLLPASLACLGLLGAGSQVGAKLVAPLMLATAMLLLSLLRPAALGMGDSKTALLLVCGLGPEASDALYAGIATAALCALALLARHGRRALARPLPLAPFRTLGALLTLLR